MSMTEFENSELVMGGFKILGSTMEELSNSKREFLQIQDSLFTTCLLQNVRRPVPLENALVQCFERAVFCWATNTWMLLVDHHKTTCQQGSAKIVLDKVLHRWITIYVKHIQPQFAGID